MNRKEAETVLWCLSRKPITEKEREALNIAINILRYAIQLEEGGNE